jgi:hypothetical protein
MKETKVDKIEKYLLEGNTISPREAQELFNSWRLGDVIWKLKKRGHHIETIKEKHNDGVHARYRIFYAAYDYLEKTVAKITPEIAERTRKAQELMKTYPPFKEKKVETLFTPHHET